MGGERASFMVHSALRTVCRSLSHPSPGLRSMISGPPSLQVTRARALAQAGYCHAQPRLFRNRAWLRPLLLLWRISAPSIPRDRGRFFRYQCRPHMWMSKLKNGWAGGRSGWTGELVAPLADDEECLQGLAALVRDILNGVLDANSRSLLMASLLIPGAKMGVCARLQSPSVSISWHPCMPWP